MPPKKKSSVKKAIPASSKRKKPEKEESVEEVISVADTTGTESVDTASVAFSDSSLEELFPNRKRGRGQTVKGGKKVQKTLTGETYKGERSTNPNSSGNIEPSLKTVPGIEKIKINYVKSEEEISNNPNPNISQKEFEEYLLQIIKDLSMLHSCGEKKPTLSYSSGEEELDYEANDVAEVPPEENGDEVDEEAEATLTPDAAANDSSNVCPNVQELTRLLKEHKVYDLIKRMAQPKGKGRVVKRDRQIMTNKLTEITRVNTTLLRAQKGNTAKNVSCIKQTYLFPCVVEFVLRLCSRVENDSSGLVSSLELLHFIMTEIQRSALNFAMLLFVSCPACLPMFYQRQKFSHALAFLSGVLYKAGLIKEEDLIEQEETNSVKVVFLLKVLEIEAEYFDPSTGIFSVFCKKNPNNRSSFWRQHSCPCAYTHQTVFQLLQFSGYGPRENCMIAPPHFVPWTFLSSVYDASLSIESEATGDCTGKKKGAKKQTKIQKGKKAAAAVDPTPTHEKWATTMLQHIRLESEVFDESNHNKRYNNIVLTHQYILSQMDPSKKNDAGFNLYILLKQTARDSPNYSLAGDRKAVESLLPLLDVTNHIALQLKGGDGEKCACTTLPYTSTYIEHHERHLAALVNSLEEEELIPFSCVPMKNSQYRSLLKEEQFYSRGAGVAYENQQDLFQTLSIDDIIFNACEAGNRLCDVEKELTTNEQSAHLLDQLHKTYIKNCTLKQHQIRNLLRMSRREETPFHGYFEFPLLQLITEANGNVSVSDGGSFFYCALNGSRRYVCDASTIQDGDADLRPTRGGFFCDSVGLGKTLSLIALSAHDRLVGETMKDGREVSERQKKESDSIVVCTRQRSSSSPCRFCKVVHRGAL
ncbi:hypothetical protein, conserved [Angomonas deanei]|uniref:SNF2 family N-terminal domain containing protein n=1 Tax=Angomonas deanei TaxID=59799 RepID=A0A7G2C2B8_9TRYP|nr:hypothetical protein, conserved [Angomonas deanei]